MAITIRIPVRWMKALQGWKGSLTPTAVSARSRRALHCSMQAVLAQDIEDLTALKVSKTPTFLVNGRSLPSFGPEQLARLVAEEIGKTSP